MKDQPLYKTYYKQKEKLKKRGYGWLISLGVVLIAVACFIFLIWYSRSK